MNLFKLKSHVIIRSLTVALSVILQGITMYVLGYYLIESASQAYVLLEIISIIVVFGLVSNEESLKQIWIIIVLVLPVTGLFLYAMWGKQHRNSRTSIQYRKTEREFRNRAPQEDGIISKLQEVHPNKAQIARYLSKEGFAMYKGTDVRYYTVGETAFEAMIDDMSQAEHFIFLEYFIVSEGELWDRVKTILAKKAADGLDIRLLIDDFGSIVINTREFQQEMAELGIRLAIFAPIHKDISRLSFNYRNHQKITIIDGNIGYCGGLNIADEYVNIYARFGHWKDTAVRLEGEAVWGLTNILLSMWSMSKFTDEINVERFRPTINVPSVGFIQPFADGPANNPDNPAEETYTHMINKARDYIYFTTPYLVLDRKMVEDLCRAARSGVQVHIVTPRIYDKWYVYMVTVANYGELLKNGVHIHEYLPGFIHSKTAVSDDVCAICGTVNMDFRSFYLHYECGVFMCETEAVLHIKADILETMRKSEEITYDQWLNRPLHMKAVQRLLKIMSPLF